MKFSAAIILGFCLALGSLGSFAQQNPAIDSLGFKKPADVKTFIANNPGLVILDVRTPEEFKKTHLENAVNINYYNPDFLNNLKALDPKKIYLIYCATGCRSRATASALKSMEFEQVRYFAGFFIDLEKEFKP
jgi:rhodanese-related sulfurtransferase